MLMKNIDQQFDFDKNRINRLVIENPVEWRGFLLRLQRQISNSEEFIMIFENLKEQSFAKCVDVIYSPMNLSSNQTRLLNKLYKALAEDCSKGEKVLETLESKSNIVSFVSNLIFDKEISLTLNDDFDLTGLFKLVGVKFEDTDNDIMSNLLDYMIATRELEGDKIFIFIGLSDFLSTYDKDVFYESIISKEFKILLIDRNIYEKHRYENVVVIDEDLCEI